MLIRHLGRCAWAVHDFKPDFTSILMYSLAFREYSQCKGGTPQMSNSFVLESVEHDSQNEIYRYPTGAAEAQSMVRMRIKVQAQSKNISVKIH